MDAGKKYWAFLSYSHQDTKVCEWLHQSLESFRVPKRLVGRATRDGNIPGRLFPVFRDRDELPGSSELGKNLTEALAQSRYLIVICSPLAARSRWVNEEIRQFKMMGGEGQVLALIVDGEPNAADKPNSGLLECFPEAMKYRVDASGNLTGQRVEPIAADVRRGRETKSIALLRLIAGLLGVPFDELRQRDRERTRRTVAVRAVVGIALISLLAGSLFWRYRQDRMERLEELGREALMQSQPTRAAVFLAETYRMGNNSRDVRIMLDQAMRSVDMLSTVHTAHPDGIVDAAFSSDATRLIATSVRGDVSIWRADNGRRLVSLPALSGKPVLLARFTNGGREVATVFDGGRIAILKARDGLPLREINLPGEIRILPAGQQPLSGDRVLYTNVRGDVFLVDLSRSGEARALGEACKFAAVNAEAIICVTKPGDKSGANVHALAAGAQPKALALPADATAISLVPATRKAAIALASGTWQLIDLVTAKRVAEAAHPGGIASIASSANGNLIATGGITGSVLLWSSTSGQLVTLMQAHVGRVSALHFLADDRRIASVGDDGTVKVWDTASGAMLSVNQTGTGELTRTAMSPDGARLATWVVASANSRDRAMATLKVWDLATAGPLTIVANAKDLQEKLLATRKTATNGQPTAQCAGKLRPQANADSSLTLFAAGTDSPVANLQAGQDTADARLACDNALQWYLTGGKSGGAILWSAANVKPVSRFSGHVRAIEDVAFLPAEGEIMTFGSDGTAARWTFEEERRAPGVISRRIACRVPLRLEGYLLRPYAGAERDCAIR